MKYIGFLGTLALAASAFAQSINIATPVPGQHLTIGGPQGNFTVEVDLPTTISPSQSVSVVVSLQNCGTSACSASGDPILGEILFAGNYSPQKHENFKPPYQNFTFVASTVAQPGNATIHVAHFFLIGAGPSPILETKNVNVIFRGFR